MMRRFLVKQVPKPQKAIELDKTEARHALKVLRLQNGQEVEAIDGQGGSAICEIQISGSHAQLLFKKEGRKNSDSIVPLQLSVALTKSSSFEWIIEKSVELGVQSVEPMLSEHSVIKLNKPVDHYLSKWQKIADQALKQCGRLKALEILPPITVTEKLKKTQAHSLVLICNETLSVKDSALLSVLHENQKKLQDVCILVGPEGGWSQNELESFSHSAFQNVTLGSLTLRAETAALFCASTFNSFFYWTKSS